MQKALSLPGFGILASLCIAAILSTSCARRNFKNFLD